MTQKLPDEQIKQLQAKFLNKRISVPTVNNTGYGMPGKSFIVGKCTYLGYNPLLPSWGLQVTVNRTPIQNVDYTQINLV